jgi:hypothetical protein
MDPFDISYNPSRNVNEHVLSIYLDSFENAACQLKEKDVDIMAI